MARDLHFHNNQGSGQINQGETVSAITYNAPVTLGNGAQISLGSFFDTLASGIEEAEAAVQDREIARAEVIEPLREMAVEPLPDSEPERQTLRARIGEVCGKLGPYVPYIRKTLAAFGEGAIGTFASGALPPPASWVVAGVMEVLRDNRK